MHRTHTKANTKTRPTQTRLNNRNHNQQKNKRALHVHTRRTGAHDISKHYMRPFSLYNASTVISIPTDNASAPSIILPALPTQHPYLHTIQNIHPTTTTIIISPVTEHNIRKSKQSPSKYQSISFRTHVQDNSTTATPSKTKQSQLITQLHYYELNAPNPLHDASQYTNTTTFFDNAQITTNNTNQRYNSFMIFGHNSISQTTIFYPIDPRSHAQ